MQPFTNFSFTKQAEGQLLIAFDYVNVLDGFNEALVLVVEQDGTKDVWDLRHREYTATSAGGISTTRYAFYNTSYSDWLAIPDNTSGDRDDHGRRVFRRPIVPGPNEMIATYRPDQPDPSSGLEFYCLVAVVAVAGWQPVAVLGEHIVSDTISV